MRQSLAPSYPVSSTESLQYLTSTVTRSLETIIRMCGTSGLEVSGKVHKGMNQVIHVSFSEIDDTEVVSCLNVVERDVVNPSVLDVFVLNTASERETTYAKAISVELLRYSGMRCCH